MARIGFIGMGNMGYAILKGVLGYISPDDIIFSCKTDKKRQDVSKETKVHYAKDNIECAANAKYIILAIKPQQYEKVLSEIKSAITNDKVLISLAPSYTIDKIKNILGGNARIVRAMPNTPALLGEAASGVSYIDSELSEDEKKEIENIFNSFGIMKKVDESLMSTVVAVSGSSPAFVYMFIDALADAGVRYGLKKSDALEMASQTVLGSAMMVLKSGESPSILKDRVCSPGGTTIEGVSVLNENAFAGIIQKACKACYDKCSNIG